MTTRTAKKPTVTDEHKAAMAQGRAEGRAVKAYLAALPSASSGGRGRPRNPDALRRRLEVVTAAIDESELVDKLLLVQERIGLEKEIEALDSQDDFDGVQADFINVCKAYSERKGVSYAAWREMGVPADVLRRAGLSRNYEGG